MNREFYLQLRNIRLKQYFRAGAARSRIILLGSGAGAVTCCGSTLDVQNHFHLKMAQIGTYLLFPLTFKTIKK
jgi:hypothetical protein